MVVVGRPAGVLSLHGPQEQHIQTQAQLCSLKVVLKLTHANTHTTLSKVSLFKSLPLTHIIMHWKLHCVRVKEGAGYWASHKSQSHLKSPSLTHLSVTEVAATELLRAAQLSHTDLFYISTDLSEILTTPNQETSKHPSPSALRILECI